MKKKKAFEFRIEYDTFKGKQNKLQNKVDS